MIEILHNRFSKSKGEQVIFVNRFWSISSSHCECVNPSSFLFENLLSFLPMLHKTSGEFSLPSLSLLYIFRCHLSVMKREQHKWLVFWGEGRSTRVLLQAFQKHRLSLFLQHGAAAAFPWAAASSLIALVRPHLVCMSSTTVPSQEGVFLRRISKSTLSVFQPSYRRYLYYRTAGVDT